MTKLDVMVAFFYGGASIGFTVVLTSLYFVDALSWPLWACLLPVISYVALSVLLTLAASLISNARGK